MQWLQQLPKPHQDDVVDLANESRREALKYHKEDDKIFKKRKENMLQAYTRQQTLQQKEAGEAYTTERTSHHLIC